MNPLEPPLTAQNKRGQRHPLMTRRRRNRGLTAAPRGWGDDVRIRPRRESGEVGNLDAPSLPLPQTQRPFRGSKSSGGFRVLHVLISTRTVGTWTVVPRGYFPPARRGEA